MYFDWNLPLISYLKIIIPLYIQTFRKYIFQLLVIFLQMFCFGDRFHLYIPSTLEA